MTEVSVKPELIEAVHAVDRKRSERAEVEAAEETVQPSARAGTERDPTGSNQFKF